MTLRLRIDEFRSRESRGPLPVPAGAGYPAQLPEPRQASIDRPGGTGSLSGAYDEHRLHQVYNFWRFLPLWQFFGTF